MATDSHGVELAKGDRVRVLAGDDQGREGRVLDATGGYVVVELPDGVGLRCQSANVVKMETSLMELSPIALMDYARCPYCERGVTMFAQRLGDHYTHGGPCDGSQRKVASFDTAGRAVLARAESTGKCPDCGASGVDLNPDGTLKVHPYGNHDDRSGRATLCKGNGKQGMDKMSLFYMKAGDRVRDSDGKCGTLVEDEHPPEGFNRASWAKIKWDDGRVNEQATMFLYRA